MCLVELAGQSACFSLSLSLSLWVDVGVHMQEVSTHTDRWNALAELGVGSWQAGPAGCLGRHPARRTHHHLHLPLSLRPWTARPVSSSPPQPLGPAPRARCSPGARLPELSSAGCGKESRPPGRSRRRARPPHRRQQLVLRAGHRDLVVALLEAEVAGQAAAAAAQFAGQAGAVAQAAVRGVAQDRVLVAVGLADRRAVQAGRGPVGGVASPAPPRRSGPRRRAGARRGSSGEQFGRSVRSVAAQLGSRTTTGECPASSERFASSVERAAQHRAGPVQLARRDIGQAAADPAGRAAARSPAGPPPPGPGPPPGPLRRQVLGEGVGPQQDVTVRPRRAPRPSASGPPPRLPRTTG